ncbi:hypothetical protein [Butyrivibrio sp. AD3002]|uniref:hypothetical protein n=1 Tax=Butyrivibrio sp. AD3002 TaxID=1280670 RepID=UPI0003B2F505|nr:hypothetical protein [Butyrivibrio sp. AD3002]
MYEKRFDPMTGKPLNPDSVNQQAENQQPVNQQPNNQQTYGTQQTYGPQQTYGMPQNNATQQTYSAPQNYTYDPAAIEKAQSDKNKKLAYVLLGVCAVLFMVVLGFGAFTVMKFFAKNSSGSDADQRIEAAAEESETSEFAFDEEGTTEEVTDEDAADEAAVEEIPGLQMIEEPNAEDFLSEDTDSYTEEDYTQAGSAAEAVPENIYNLYTVQLGDDTYHIPAKLTDFLEKGWTLPDEKTAQEVLANREMASVELYSPDGSNNYLDVDVTNFDVNSQALRDCYVSKISLDDYVTEKTGIEFKSYNGDLVVGKSTRDDIIAAAGEPSDVIDSAGHISLFYEGIAETYLGSEVIYYLDENDVLDYVVVRSDNAPEDFVATEISDEAPAYLDQYVAPTSLGNDPFSGNYKLDGVLYNLPTPFYEITNNGWDYPGNPDEIVEAGQMYSVRFDKGDRSLYATVYNPSEEATYLKYSMIISVSDPRGLSANDLEFPGGLSGSITEGQLLTYLDKNGITNYDYNKGPGCYHIYFDQTGNDRSMANDWYQIFADGNEIIDIEMQNYGWLK